MAKAGDQMIITFHSQASLRWGTHRKGGSRALRGGECYMPIPRAEARRLHLRNSNYGSGLGINIYIAHSTDGIFNDELKCAGCSKKGDIYGKQFQGNGKLRVLHPWFAYNHAQIGDQVRIVWVTDTDLELTFIKK